MKKDPRPQQAAAKQTDASELEKMNSVEWRFAEALVRHKGNQTAAAKEIFTVGKKGGKAHEATAASMGSRMCRNVKMQEYRRELLLERLNVDAAVDTLNEVMMDKKKTQSHTRVDVAFKMLESAGVVRKGHQTEQAPVVYLVNPTPPKGVTAK